MPRARWTGVSYRFSDEREIDVCVERVMAWECALMRSLKKIRAFRHPCILKFIEGNESETGVFYVRIACSCWLIV